MCVYKVIVGSILTHEDDLRFFCLQLFSIVHYSDTKF